MVFPLMAMAGGYVAKKIGSKLVGSALKRLGKKTFMSAAKRLGKKAIGSVKEKLLNKAKEKAQDAVKAKLADVLGVSKREGKAVSRRAIEKIRHDERSTKGAASATHLGELDYSGKKGLYHDVGSHLKKSLPKDYERQARNTASAVGKHMRASGGQTARRRENPKQHNKDRYGKSGYSRIFY